MVDQSSSIAVLAVIAFGIIQIRQFPQQRRDLAANELVWSVEDHEFADAIR